MAITVIQMIRAENSVFLYSEQKSMEIIGFTPEDIVSVFQILSAVLKLGNLQFIPRANIDGTEGCALLNQYGQNEHLID